MAAVTLQVTVDCSDPRRMAAFWSKALGYVVESMIRRMPSEPL
jgi:hypothetical protein